MIYLFYFIFRITQWYHRLPFRVPTLLAFSRDPNPGLYRTGCRTNQLNHHHTSLLSQFTGLLFIAWIGIRKCPSNFSHFSRTLRIDTVFVQPIPVPVSNNVQTRVAESEPKPFFVRSVPKPDLRLRPGSFLYFFVRLEPEPSKCDGSARNPG